MDALTAGRLISGILWAMIAVWFSGSVYRRTCGDRSRIYDGFWALFFWIALVFVMALIKWYTGITTPVQSAGDRDGTTAIFVLTILCALGVMRQRWLIEAWRW